jgi:HEAT repeat protein
MASSLGADAASRVLVLGVHDSDPSVVRVATRGLAELGGPAAEGALTELLMRSDSSDDARKLAAGALQQMGGDGARRFRDLIAKYATEDEDDSSSD